MTSLDVGGQGMPERIRGMMPGLTTELAELVAIRSVSEVGYPEPTRAALLEARDMVARLFASAGCSGVRSLESAGHGARSSPARSRRPRRPDRPALQPLRRRPAGRRDARELAAVRGRPSATARSSAAAPPTPSRTSWSTSARCAPGTGGRRSASGSCIEGQEEVGSGALHGVPAERPRALRRRRHGDRRHGQRPSGRPDADGGAARDGAT